VREEDERGCVFDGGAAQGSQVAGVVGAGCFDWRDEASLSYPPGEQRVRIARGGREEEARGYAGDVGEARQRAMMLAARVVEAWGAGP
jgi:hypothetical protein